MYGQTSTTPMISALPTPADDGSRHDWVAHHRVRSPHKAALTDLDSRTSLTWAQLDRRVDSWREVFADAGLNIGDRVAVLAVNCLQTLEIQFACARGGLVFVPLNWRLAPAELAYIVADAEPAVVVADARHEAAARELAHGLDAPFVSITVAPDLPTRNLPDVDVPLRSIAMLMYTSGTTGRPKGAIITHRMTFWHAVNISPPARVTKDSVHLAVLPFFHTGGLNLYVNPVLHAGGTVVVASRVDAAQIFGALRDRALGITHVFAVPTVYQLLADSPEFEGADLSRLVTTGVGGAACPAPLLDRWAAKGRPLAQGWGMTEAGPSGTVCDPDDATTPPTSVGKPLLHISVRFVSLDGLDVPDGSVGELWIAGPSITPGYWRNEQATADAFRDGWFRTGDAGYRDAHGNIVIVDRWKDMFISGGENVYPAEVEAALADLAGVSAAAVIGVADNRWGEVGRAFVVPEPGADLSAAAVIGHCTTRLAKFKVPAEVVFLEELPMTGSGKIMKRSLPSTPLES